MIIIMSKETKWKYEIGEIIQDDKRDLVIIDKKKIQNKEGQWKKYYKYKCNKCAYRDWETDRKSVV